MNIAEALGKKGRRDAWETPSALYVHVPFCVSRCAYCDFHSFDARRIPEGIMGAYSDFVVRRCAELGERLDISSFHTIYIGGGTPTALDDGSFGRLVDGIDRLYGAGCREWTVEANPESLGESKIEMLGKTHATRLSIGIQSMDDGELELLGRRGRAETNRRAIRLAAESGLEVSADLITGLPRPPGKPGRPESLSEAVGFLVDSGIRHLSIYDLVVEEGTPIARSIESGDLETADTDEEWRRREDAGKILARGDLRRYEVSNYAVPGHECLHNMHYWDMDSYLGAGSGAVSTLRPAGARCEKRSMGTVRLEECRNLSRYMEDADASGGATPVSARDSAFEMIMMGLRTSLGLDALKFGKRFGVAPRDLFPHAMERWHERFRDSGGRLSLDSRGLDILNRILVDALSEMEENFFGMAWPASDFDILRQEEV